MDDNNHGLWFPVPNILQSQNKRQTIYLWSWIEYLSYGIYLIEKNLTELAFTDTISAKTELVQ